MDRIKRFSCRKFVKYSNIVIYGGRGSGKSSVLKWILYYKHKRFYTSLMVSGTALTTKDFTPFMAEGTIYNDFQLSAIETLLAEQMKVRIETEHGKRKKTLKHDVVVILDDILHLDKSWQKSESIKTLIFNGRHYYADLIICIQDIIAIPPGFRSNIDYLVITNVKEENSMKKLYDNYWNHGFGNRKVMEEVVKKCTEGYRVMVIDNKNANKSQDLYDCVFYMEIPDPQFIPPFILGSKTIFKKLKNVEKKEEDLIKKKSD